MNQQIKNWVLQAIVFSLTVWLIWASYAAYQSWSGDVGGWWTLTATLWNKMQDNQTDFNTRITTLEWSSFTWFSNLHESSGNIWIGSSSPGVPLQVWYSSIATVSDMIVNSSTSENTWLSFWEDDNNRWWIAWEPGNDRITFWTVTASNVEINTLVVNDGNVWIGTVTPWAKLEVSGWETILQQESWINATLQNGWVWDTGLSYNVPGYYKDSTGRVWLRWGLKWGSLWSACAFTLPVWYRPAVDSTWLSTAWNSWADAQSTRVAINTSWCVQIYQESNQGTSTVMSVDNVSFSTH